MSSLSSLNGPEAEPSQASGARCCPMEEGSGDLASNGRRGSVPRAPSKLGCAGGGAGGAAILDGRGRGGMGGGKRAGRGLRAGSRAGGGPGVGWSPSGPGNRPEEHDPARRLPSGGGREVPRAV